MLKVPLSKENYLKEYRYLKGVAVFNGYKSDLIDQIIRKCNFKLARSNATSLTPIKEDNKWVKLTYLPKVTKFVESSLKKSGLKVAYSSSHKIRQLVGSSKDIVPSLSKSGIYCFDCTRCNKKYVRDQKKLRLQHMLSTLFTQRLEFPCWRKLGIGGCWMLMKVYTFINSGTPR